jgi:2-hydroxychromene-2-carboxylate isomerase
MVLLSRFPHFAKIMQAVLRDFTDSLSPLRGDSMRTLAMDLAVEVYWSFRSPYSYIVLPRIRDLREKFCVTIDLRVVHPAAVRNPAHFARMDPLARPYFLKDSTRVAAFHGMAFRRPVPDPINQDRTTLAIAAEQPQARRLGRLGIAATERGRGFEFCSEVAALLWDGSVTGWDQGTHLDDAAARAGLSLAELDAAITADHQRHEESLAQP